MSNESRRMWVIEGTPLGMTDDGGMVLDSTFDMDRAQELAFRLLGTLAEIGGMVSFTADRVKRATGPGGQPLAESERLIVEWRSFSPMRPADDARVREYEVYEDERDPEEIRAEAEPPEPDIAGALEDAARASGIEPPNGAGEWAADAELEDDDVDTSGVEAEETRHRVGVVGERRNFEEG